MYDVFAASPMSENVVDMDVVFATMVDQVEPALADLSILYPVIADPPLLIGAFQLRLICDVDTADAAKLVGDCGAVVPVLPVEKYAVRVTDCAGVIVLYGLVLPSSQ